MKVTIVAEVSENSRIPQWLIYAAAAGVKLTINTNRPARTPKPEPVKP